MLFSSIPTLSFFIILISICSYSVSRCRKTAAFYRQLDSTPRNLSHISKVPEINRVEKKLNYNKPTFCANCGAPRRESHQFCINCGYELN